MNSMVIPVLCVVAAYLIGSVSFAVLSSKLFGLADPRSYGSGNPGATNVLRSGNKKAALFTLIGDALKGVLAVLLAKWAMHQFNLDSAVPALCGLAAFVGHLYPVFHGFKGGKGVATAAGVLLSLNIWLGLVTALAWGLVFAFFRVSSVAAIVAAVVAAFYQGLVHGFNVESLAIFLMCGLLVIRHQENIKRLMSGEESRIGKKKAKLDAAEANREPVKHPGKGHHQRKGH